MEKGYIQQISPGIHNLHIIEPPHPPKCWELDKISRSCSSSKKNILTDNSEYFHSLPTSNVFSCPSSWTQGVGGIQLQNSPKKRSTNAHKCWGVSEANYKTWRVRRFPRNPLHQCKYGEKIKQDSAICHTRFPNWITNDISWVTLKKFFTWKRTLVGWRMGKNWLYGRCVVSFIAKL